MNSMQCMRCHRFSISPEDLPSDLCTGERNQTWFRLMQNSSPKHSLLRMIVLISFSKIKLSPTTFSLVDSVHIKPSNKAPRFHDISETGKDSQRILIFYNSNKEVSITPQHVLVPPTNRCREFSQRFQQQQKHIKSCEQKREESCRL